MEHEELGRESFGTELPSSTSSQDEIYHRLGIHHIDPPVETFLGNPSEFSEATRQAYPFTTEDMSSYMGELDLRDKRVAGIAGSGDFAFNAFLYGAASVDAVDISPVACFQGELKAAALAQLGYPEFLRFFAATEDYALGPEAYSHDQYQRLRENISEEAQYFYDQLITPEGRSPFITPGGLLIDKLGVLDDGMDLIKEMDPFLRSEEEYRRAQDALKPMRFYPQPITTFLGQRAGSDLDLIYLSNIFAYPPYKGHQGQEVIDRTLQAAVDALAPGGEVVMNRFLPDTPQVRGARSGREERWEERGMSFKHVIGTLPYRPDYLQYVSIMKKPLQ